MFEFILLCFISFPLLILLYLKNKKTHRSLRKKATIHKRQFIVLKNKRVVAINKILYIISKPEAIELYIEKEPFPEYERSSLLQILKKLPAKQFTKINRSCVLNIAKIKRIYPDKVQITDGTWIKVTKTYQKAFFMLLRKK